MWIACAIALNKVALEALDVVVRGDVYAAGELAAGRELLAVLVVEDTLIV